MHWKVVSLVSIGIHNGTSVTVQSLHSLVVVKFTTDNLNWNSEATRFSFINYHFCVNIFIHQPRNSLSLNEPQHVSLFCVNSEGLDQPVYSEVSSMAENMIKEK